MEGTGSMAVKVIFIILGLIGLYYLYIYLFGSSLSAAVILSEKLKANESITIPTLSARDLPPLYVGGEFAISTWINITNWGYKNGTNKSILRIGGNTRDTIRIYLGAKAPQLIIRLDTSQPLSTGTSSSTSTPAGTVANTSTLGLLNTGSGATSAATVFSTQTSTAPPETISDLTANKNECDVLQIDMQRWVNIVVSVNGMSCDVYLDGKLVRSCVLDNYYNVDTDYTLKMLDNGGFGGYISTTQMYGQALSPDIVYQNYMAGPEPTTTFLQYITSFFSPARAY